MKLPDNVARFGGSLLRAFPYPRVIRIPTGINRHQKWVRSAANAWEWLGIYEADKQQIVSSLVKPGACVYDVGANAGFYSLAFARLVGPSGTVVAIEPLPANVQKLLRHVALNRIANIRVIQGAVAARSQLVGFETGADDFTGRIARDTRYLIPAVSLDELTTTGQMPDPDLLKIDVEGAEHSVLEGGRALLQRKAPQILLALHGHEPKRQCVTLLKELGYSLFDLQRNPLRDDAEVPNEIFAARCGGQ